SVREHLLDFRRPKIAAVLSSWKEVLYVGIPAAATRMIVPVGAAIVTRILSAYGPEAVAGYGVATRIEFFGLAIIRALAAVMAPFIGQNLGAGKLNRIREGYRAAQRMSVIVGGLFFAVLFVLAGPIARLFTEAPDVVKTTIRYLRIVPVAYALQGIYLISAPGLNVLHKPLIAAGLGATEMFALIAPLALLGSWLFGITGVFAGIAVSYAVTGILSRVAFRRTLASITTA
ncbi:MAG: hypothetical protein KAU31_08400, partial [Spirochaetaceae bacterium]|nr:hypothetical protein [Spirochaetaceae bacterium]